MTRQLSLDEQETGLTVAARGALDLERQVREKHQHLRYFIQRRIGNGPDVDDLLQATYLEAWKNAPCYRGLSRPDVWLFGIALNLIRCYLKRERRQRQREQPFDSDGVEWSTGRASDPSNITANRRQLEDIGDAYERLPREMKDVLSLVVSSSREYEEAARVTGVPVGTVRSRLCRARKRLRTFSSR